MAKISGYDIDLYYLIFLGFPTSCYNKDSMQPKFMSMSVHLNSSQFHQIIRELCPKLGQAFKFFKLSNNKHLQPLEIETPLELLECGYKGVCIVTSLSSSVIDINNVSSSSIIHSTQSQSTNSNPVLPLFTPSISITPTTSAITNPIQTQSIISNPNLLPRTTVPLINNTIDSTSSHTSIPRLIISPNNYDLTTMRKARLEGLNDTQQIWIRRENIVHDAIEVYKNPSILECKVFVKFMDEIAEDLDGVTREFFSSFWAQFLSEYGAGESIKYLSLSPDVCVSEDELCAAGRILLHGFLLTGFIPLSLNHAVLFKLLTGRDPSNKITTRSYLACLSETDQHTLDVAKSVTSYDSIMQVKLAEIFSMCRLSSIPSPESFKQTLDNISKYVTLISPYFAISFMITADNILMTSLKIHFSITSLQ